MLAARTVELHGSKRIEVTRVLATRAFCSRVPTADFGILKRDAAVIVAFDGEVIRVEVKYRRRHDPT
jgi:hypothetical protein